MLRNNVELFNNRENQQKVGLHFVILILVSQSESEYLIVTTHFYYLTKRNHKEMDCCIENWNAQFNNVQFDVIVGLKIFLHKKTSRHVQVHICMYF